MRILTINSGSSSIKFSLHDIEGVDAGRTSEALVLSGVIERIESGGGVLRVKGPAGDVLTEGPHDLRDHAAALRALAAWLERHADGGAPSAVGHRIVHGGPRFREPQRITPAVLVALRSAIPLAPNHLPNELEAIDTMARAYPDVPQVACFDTAFHRHMPPVAQLYALPRALWQEGVRRYGFHGLSYEYIVGELQREGALGAHAIIAHLGNGASVVAVRDGVGIDTTMGFTPTGGLVMSTRSGDLDPNVVLYLLREGRLPLASVNDLVNRSGGLLALSGVSADMRDLLRLEHGHPHAAEAVAMFCYRVRQAIGAMAASLGGLDTLVFTAGIGEHAPSIRWRICEGLQVLGVVLDPARNDANAPIVSRDASAVTVRVVPTNEELMIARHTHRLLVASPADPPSA